MIIAKKQQPRLLEEKISKAEIETLVDRVKGFNIHATLLAVGNVYGIGNMIEGDYAAGALGFLVAGVCGYLAYNAQHSYKELEHKLSQYFKQ